MADYSELIERLEKATGPDRELDEAIACFIAPPHPKYGKPVGMISSKEFTRSIDAALTLVPDDFLWAVSAEPPEHHGRTYHAGITAGSFAGPEERWSADYATSPAVALCIAALKARAALFGSKGTK